MSAFGLIPESVERFLVNPGKAVNGPGEGQMKVIYRPAQNLEGSMEFWLDIERASERAGHKMSYIGHVP